MTNALRTAAEDMAATTDVVATAEAKKPVRKTFASLLGTINKATISHASGGKVKPMSKEDVRKEFPELVDGHWDGEGKPHTAENTGITATIFDDVKGVGGMKGVKYVSRPYIRLTPRLAAFILASQSGHNRDSIEPAVNRYAEDMSNGNWHYVGNTLGFVSAKPNDLLPTGQCNGGHTCKGVVKSGKTILITAYMGIPEQFANLADVNIPRTGKDIVGRRHRYDEYEEIDSLDGEPLGVTLKKSDTKSMSNVHSQTLRIVACTLSGKKVKDSEPLPPSKFSELDDKYGDLIVPCVLRAYLLDKAAQQENAKGKLVAGALKKIMSLSHVAGLMCIYSTVEVEGGKYEIDQDELMTAGEFFTKMVDFNNDDTDDAPVALREALSSFKIDKMTDQNIRFSVAKTALANFVTGDSDQFPADVDSLMADDGKAVVHFDTYLDRKPVTDAGDEMEKEEEDNDESEE